MNNKFNIYRIAVSILLFFALQGSINGQPLIFEKNYNWTDNDRTIDFIPIYDNGYALLSITGTNMCVMKLDSNGDSLWSYEGSMIGRQIIESSNTDLLITGRYENNAILLRISNDGEFISSFIESRPDRENTYAGVAELSNGDLIISEIIYDDNFIPWNSLVRYSSSGLEIWRTGGDDYLHNSLIITSDSCILSIMIDLLATHSYILKRDLNGNPVMSSNIGNGPGYQVIESSNFNYFLAIDTHFEGDFYNAIKMDSSGNILWQLRETTEFDVEHAYTICQLNADQFAIGGKSQNILTIKTVSDSGDTLSFYSYNKFQAQYAQKMYSDSENIIVAGSVIDSTDNKSILVFKMPIDSLITSSNSISYSSTNIEPTIFPNPVYDNIHISHLFDTSESVEIKIYDSNGKLKITENFSPLINPIICNVNTLLMGTYILKIKSGVKEYNLKFIKH
jgi:type IX secretion system substrate protein